MVKLRKRSKKSEVSGSVRARLAQTLDEYKLGSKQLEPLRKSGKPVLALFDGDIACHVATERALREVYHRDSDCFSWQMDFAQAKEDLDSFINSITTWLGAEKLLVAFGSKPYFRKRLFPGYKANRRQKKPLGYWQLVDYCRQRWPSKAVPGLEADDVLGIEGTRPTNRREFVPFIVTNDKDMLTIPCAQLQLKAQASGNQGIHYPTREEADTFHLVQTLTGDPGDGYDGLRGIGEVKARKILDSAGKSPKKRWDAVKQAYADAGLTEKDAILTAQLARILRHSDYRSGGVVLWMPPTRKASKVPF